MIKINPATLEHRARELVQRTVYDINLIYGEGQVRNLSFVWGKDYGIAYRTFHRTLYSKRRFRVYQHCNKLRVSFIGHQRTIIL